jgi:multidrug efflux system membrane fusion protein
MIARVPWTALALLLFVATWGCGPKAPPKPAAEPPTVTVSKPVQRDVTNYVDFTGRTDAIFSVDVRARVTGYLVKMPFREGAEVKKDDLLFEIDPRPYQAEYDRAASDVELNEARYKLAVADNARAKVVAKTPGAISLQDLDKYQASEDEAFAAVEAAKANLEVHKINLDFTKVTSFIDGQVSRYFFTIGNLVNQDMTLLTTVVSLDPIYAYFDMDERTLLDIKRAMNAGRLEVLSQNSDIPVFLGLQGEKGFPHKGNVNFVNNKVDSSTGTITVRGVFPNPTPAHGVRELSPGLFVRIRLPIGKPHSALLVAGQAIGTDQGVKVLYVVDANNVVQYRKIRIGPLQDDGLRVIEEGLKPDDSVVITGLQQIQAKTKVRPRQIAMPVQPIEQVPEEPIANESVSTKDDGALAKSAASPSGANDERAAPPTLDAPGAVPADTTSPPSGSPPAAR